MCGEGVRCSLCVGVGVCMCLVCGFWHVGVRVCVGVCVLGCIYVCVHTAGRALCSREPEAAALLLGLRVVDVVPCGGCLRRTAVGGVVWFSLLYGT